jgi:GNAT superfamily N-acetyltransferase
MSVRQAKPRDHAAILKYAIKLVEQHQAFNSKRFVQFENHEEQLSDLFDRELNNPQARIFVLEHQGDIVGYAFVKMEARSLIDISADCAWLHDIYIDETARGRGGGKRLLDAATEAAKELGSTVLMLQVATQNPFARVLFEKFGFEAATTDMMLDLRRSK